MATGPMTTTENAPWIPEVIANEAIGLLGSYLNLGRTVSRDSDLTSVRVGQTLSIPRRGAIVAQQKVQGTPTSVQKPTADDVQVTVDQHWYIKLLEEDFTHSLQIGSVLPGYVEDGVITLAEKIEARLLTHLSEFDNIDAGGSDGDAYKGVVNARTELVKRKVPTLAPKYGYISPRLYGRLLKEEAIIDPKTSSGEVARTQGIVGTTAGFGLFEGQLTPTSGSPAWDQNFFYTKNALVLVTRPPRQIENGLGAESTLVQSDAGVALRLVRYYDGDEMGMVVQLDTIFGSGVNDERQGIVLESQ